MVWNLLFAHFLADYPLQPGWIAASKRRPPVLLLHVAIHFVVMLLLVAPAWRTVWPYLLLLAGVHFLIDRSKLEITARKPGWMVWPYLADQLLHYLVIVGVAAWIGSALESPRMLLDPHIAITLTGFLVATYVWYISERVLVHNSPEYRQEVIARAWTRMLARALLLGAFLWLAGEFNPASLAALLAIPALPYASSRFARRAFLTDLLVSAAGMVFILWAG